MSVVGYRIQLLESKRKVQEMNTVLEARNDYMIVKPSEYVTCSKSGYQFYKQHNVCDCK